MVDFENKNGMFDIEKLKRNYIGIIYQSKIAEMDKNYKNLWEK